MKVELELTQDDIDALCYASGMLKARADVRNRYDLNKYSEALWKIVTEAREQNENHVSLR